MILIKVSSINIIMLDNIQQFICSCFINKSPKIRSSEKYFNNSGGKQIDISRKHISSERRGDDNQSNSLILPASKIQQNLVITVKSTSEDVLIAQQGSKVEERYTNISHIQSNAIGSIKLIQNPTQKEINFFNQNDITQQHNNSVQTGQYPSSIKSKLWIKQDILQQQNEPQIIYHEQDYITKKYDTQIRRLNNPQIISKVRQHQEQIQSRNVVMSILQLIVQSLFQKHPLIQQQKSIQQQIQYGLTLAHDNSSAKSYFESIRTEIKANRTQNLVLQDQLAFVNSTLANIYIQQNNNRYQPYLNEAIRFYNQFPEYFQERISLYNNQALFLLKNNSIQKGIDLYEQALKEQEKYYQKDDLRLFLTQNNIACAYCEQGNEYERGNGLTMLIKLRESLAKQADSDNEILAIIKNNCDLLYRKR